MQVVVQPDIDVSGHLQNVDTEMWDGLRIFVLRSAARDLLICKSLRAHARQDGREDCVDRQPR